MSHPIQERPRVPRRPTNLACLVVLCVAVLACGCASHQHRVGAGPAGIGSTTQRQWYWFHYFHVNEVDTQRFTEGSASYAITTEFGLTDWFWSILLAPLGFSTRTVIVER